MRNTELTAYEIDCLIEQGTIWEHAIYGGEGCFWWRRGKRARRVKASLRATVTSTPETV